MTAKTHYAIYALLGVIILLLLYFVISERSARNTDIQSLQSQLTEATTISDEQAINMAQNFAMIGCTSPAGGLVRLRNRLENDRESRWFVSNRNDKAITVANDYKDYRWHYGISVDTKVVTRDRRWYIKNNKIEELDFTKC